LIRGVLIFIGVITSGQILMTSTVEEKSSRVVEVLLAAVSPIELMWGKLLGQLGVGLLILAIYIGLGILALVQYSLMGTLDPMLICIAVWFAAKVFKIGLLMQGKPPNFGTLVRWARMA
jgi:ABC-2 type transport system permease protein